MYEVTTRTTAPYASIAYIEAAWPDGTVVRASGVIVGYNDVLTALHTVYDADYGGWATSVKVVPGADTNPWNLPYGEFTNFGTLVGRASNWDLNGDGYLTQAESAGDLALIGMRSRIGDITGWLPLAQEPNDFYGVMAGYPSGGTGLMAESVYADASTSYGVYNIQSGLGTGASGGPLLKTVGGVSSVVGVLSAGDQANTTSTYAGLFTAGTWSWLQSALQANDTLLGYQLASSQPGAGGTIYTGGAGDNLLTGGDGWDTFTGAGGNDTLVGGAGIDIALYSAFRASYSVAVAAGTITIADAVPGRDGRDTLSEIERLKFADVSLAFDTDGSAGKAYRLYETVFNRTPDPGGLGFHMKSLDMGASLATVANSFVSSPEFLASGITTNEQFVNQLYLYGLNRAPDPGGFAFHTASLANGASRGDVVVTFSESPENQAAVIGVIQNGMVYTG